MFRLANAVLIALTFGTSANATEVLLKLTQDVEVVVPGDSPARSAERIIVAPSIEASPDLWVFLSKLPAGKQFLKLGPFNGIDVELLLTPSDGLSDEVNNYGRLRFMTFSTLGFAKQREKLNQLADRNKVGQFLMSDTLRKGYRMQASHFYWGQKGIRSNLVMVDIFQKEFLISVYFKWKGSEEASELVVDHMLSSIRTVSN